MFHQVKKVGVAVAALAAFALGGAAFANATASHSTTSPSTGSGQGSSSTQTRPGFPAPGTAAHETAEKPVTGSAADQARAAAVKAVGGGTAGAVTTDMRGAGYEVTVTKSDGSKVEVHLNSAFQVLRCPGGGHGGPPAGGFGGQGMPPAGPQGAPSAAY